MFWYFLYYYYFLNFHFWQINNFLSQLYLNWTGFYSHNNFSYTFWSNRMFSSNWSFSYHLSSIEQHNKFCSVTTAPKTVYMYKISMMLILEKKNLRVDMKYCIKIIIKTRNQCAIAQHKCRTHRICLNSHQNWKKNRNRRNWEKIFTFTAATTAAKRVFSDSISIVVLSCILLGKIACSYIMMFDVKILFEKKGRC